MAVYGRLWHFRQSHLRAPPDPWGCSWPKAALVDPEAGASRKAASRAQNRSTASVSQPVLVTSGNCSAILIYIELIISESIKYRLVQYQVQVASFFTSHHFTILPTSPKCSNGTGWACMCWAFPQSDCWCGAWETQIVLVHFNSTDFNSIQKPSKTHINLIQSYQSHGDIKSTSLRRCLWRPMLDQTAQAWGRTIAHDDWYDTISTTSHRWWHQWWPICNESDVMWEPSDRPGPTKPRARNPPVEAGHCPNKSGVFQRSNLVLDAVCQFVRFQFSVN